MTSETNPEQDVEGLARQEDFRRVSAALVESERRFRRMADATLDVIWITDLEPEKVVYVSPSFERIWGRRAQDLYADPHLWIQAIHPDDRDRVGNAFGAWITRQSSEPWEAEYRIVQPEGAVRWIIEHGVVISEVDGPKRVSGISKDVTDRRLVEAALRESEQRFALAVAGSADGIWDWDIVSGQMFISERGQRLYGLVPGIEVRPRSQWLEMVQMPHADVAHRRKAIADYVEGRVPAFDDEWQVRHPDGVDRWVRLRGLCVRDAEGRATRFSGSITDIDVRKRTEERFALAVAGSSDGLWDWDIPSDEMFFSERTQHLFGLQPGLTLRPRREWRSLVQLHPDDVQDQHDMVTGYLEGTLPAYDGEWRVKHADGSFRWVRIRGVCVRDGTGRATRLAGSVSDIDPHKRAQAALQQTQRLEAVGTLAGGIAHDFNNILGAILGFGEMAVKNTRTGSRLRRDLECIMTAGERGRALVERILAFSRSGISTRVPVQVEGVLREAVDILSGSVPVGIHVELNSRADRGTVLCDPTKIHQVVTNLATNAIHAMPEGGSLRIGLARTEFFELHPTTTGDIRPGQYLALSVSDDGCGISAAVQPQIFDPFFTTKDPGSGTGLGLALVHGIVIELGGAIDVSTAVGSGSTFTVYLPRIDDTDAALPSVKKVAPPRGAHQQVLVVDDEEALVRLTTERLVELGYVCVGYTSSVDALVAFEAHPDRFDAIVTDERMPELSGIAFVKAIRATRVDIPALLVSGYLGDDLVARAKAADVTCVLGKPLAADDLAVALANALAASAAEPAATTSTVLGAEVVRRRRRVRSMR